MIFVCVHVDLIIYMYPYSYIYIRIHIVLYMVGQGSSREKAFVPGPYYSLLLFLLFDLWCY